MQRFPLLAIRLAGFIALAAIAAPAFGQSGATGGGWPHYAGDHGSTKYTPLNQIDKDNFKDLEILWRWESADKDLKDKTRFRAYDFRGTPLYVDGAVYICTNFCQIAALDADTGHTRWVHDPKSYEKGPVTHGLFHHRGLEYWTDGKEERVLIATGGRQLVSVDAKTGKLDPSFGQDGVVDLTQDLGRKVNIREIAHSSPVIVCRDTVIVGSIINDFTTTKEAPPGHIRGYDVRTGQLKWLFRSIRRQGSLATTPGKAIPGSTLETRTSGR